MTDIYKVSELSSLLKRHGFIMSKSLGQNFLTDRNIIDKIISSLEIKDGDLVLEIGPGAGALTLALSEKAEIIKAVEIDSKLLPLLHEVLDKAKNAEIINEDFMKADLVILTEGKPYKLIGNLPYYITTPIIMKVLEEGPHPESMVFTIQKEVAQRLSAKPGKKDYGSITVAANYYCEVEYLFTVSREVFIPKPKVDSAVIKMTPYKKPRVKVMDESIFFGLVRAGFGQRRKTLSNSLKQMESLNTTQIKKALADADIDPMRRAETLDIEEFALLSDTVTLLLKKDA